MDFFGVNQFQLHLSREEKFTDFILTFHDSNIQGLNHDRSL